jgi:hypothetical protein
MIKLNKVGRGFALVYTITIFILLLALLLQSAGGGMFDGVVPFMILLGLVVFPWTITIPFINNLFDDSSRLEGIFIFLILAILNTFIIYCVGTFINYISKVPQKSNDKDKIISKNV